MEVVVAASAFERVVSRATLERVVMAAAFEGVITSSTPAILSRLIATTLTLHVFGLDLDAT